MTDKTFLTEDQISEVMESVNFTYDPIIFARAIEQAVLQSPKIQQALADSKRIDWYFGNADKGKWMTEYEKGCAAGWTINQWRDSIYSAIKEPKP